MSFKLLDDQILFRYVEEPDIAEVTVPDGIGVIGSMAFFRSKNLKRVIIPESVKIIEAGAFKCCYELEEITIPSGVAVIKSRAFEDCCKLKKIITDNGVEHVEKNAFDFCYSLNCLNWKGIQIPLESDHAYHHMGDILKMIYQRNLRASLPKFLKYRINWAMYVLYPEDEKIITYIQKDFRNMFHYLIDENQWDIFNKVLHSGKFVKRKNIDELIRCAIDKQNYEMQSALIRYKHEHFGYQDITDKLKL